MITPTERRTYLGSADAAAVAGLDPYRSAMDVWLEKTGQLTLRVDTVPTPGTVVINSYLQLGQVLESALLDAAEAQLGQPVIRATHIRSDWRGASLDGHTPNYAVLVESKTVGLLGGGDRDAWGEPGSDDIPVYVIAQIHHQILAVSEGTGILPQRVLVPALIAGRGLIFYDIIPSTRLLVELDKIERAFWSDCVGGLTAPPEAPAMSLDSCKRLIRLDESETMTLPQALMDKWKVARALRRVADSLVEQVDLDVWRALDTCSQGVSPNGDRVLVRPTHRRSYTVAAHDGVRLVADFADRTPPSRDRLLGDLVRQLAPDPGGGAGVGLAPALEPPENPASPVADDETVGSAPPAGDAP